MTIPIEITKITWIHSNPLAYIRYYSGNFYSENSSLKFRSNLNYIPRKVMSIQIDQIESIKLTSFPFRVDLLRRRFPEIKCIEISLKNALSDHTKTVRLACLGAFLQRNFAEHTRDRFDPIRTESIFPLLQDFLISKGVSFPENSFPHTQTTSHTDKKIAKKLEKLLGLLENSSRIPLSMMQNYLEMEKPAFDKLVVNWAVEFNFQIDGDYLISQINTIDLVMQSLDDNFASWNTEIAEQDGKI